MMLTPGRRSGWSQWSQLSSPAYSFTLYMNIFTPNNELKTSFSLGLFFDLLDFYRNLFRTGMKERVPAEWLRDIQRRRLQASQFDQIIDPLARSFNLFIVLSVKTLSLW